MELNRFGWLGLGLRSEKWRRVRVARVRVGSTAMARWTARRRWCAAATVKRWRCDDCGDAAVLRRCGGAVAVSFVGAGARRGSTARVRARKARRGCRAREQGHGEVLQLGETAVLENSASTGGGGLRRRR
jgi:hypothetical protein